MVTLVDDWEREFDDLCESLAPLFGRKEIRRRSHSYLKALFGAAERKNGWQIAEAIGEMSPDGAQRFLNQAKWDPDQLRNAIRQYVMDHLYAPDGALIIDETGFLKKGTHSVGVQRQYSGTAGRVENSQIGVFLCYTSKKGAAFIDRELYLPESWTKDPERCKQAGVPEEVAFATKTELGRRMVMRALDAGVSCAWVLGDEVYGKDRQLRRELEQRHQSFVLAVGVNEQVVISPGQQRRVDEIAKDAPSEAWERHSAGQGSKGPRLYDWFWTPLWHLQITPEQQAQGHWLLVRRSIANPDDLAFYVVFAPREATTLFLLAGVAGLRWSIESGFECAKGKCGLDDYEVRKWKSWYRHITLCLLAHAFLMTMRSQHLDEAGTAREGAFKQDNIEFELGRVGPSECS